MTKKTLANANFFLQHLYTAEKETGLAILFLDWIKTLLQPQQNQRLQIPDSSFNKIVTHFRKNESLLLSKRGKFSDWLSTLINMLQQAKDSSDIHDHIVKKLCLFDQVNASDIALHDQIIHLIYANRAKPSSLNAFRKIWKASFTDIAQSVLWFKLDLEKSEHEVKNHLTLSTAPSDSDLALKINQQFDSLFSDSDVDRIYVELEYFIKTLRLDAPEFIQTPLQLFNSILMTPIGHQQLLLPQVPVSRLADESTPLTRGYYPQYDFGQSQNTNTETKSCIQEFDMEPVTIKEKTSNCLII